MLNIEKSNNRAQAVDHYIHNGYTLFAANADKTPRTGWTYAEFNPLCTSDSFSSTHIGVKLGADDIVIDFDPRRGELQLALLEKQLGKPFITFTVQSPSGGLHLYFKNPGNIPTLPVVPGFPALEVKRQGSYVIAGGSPNYTILNAVPPVTVPDELLRLIERNVDFAEVESTEYADDATKDRFLIHLHNAPPAIEGDLGDLQTYKIACQGRDFGLPEEDTYALMRDYYNPKCQPPWRESELKAKVAHAYKYAKSKQGVNDPRTDFDGLDLEHLMPAKTTAKKPKSKGKWRLKEMLDWLIASLPPATFRVNRFSNTVEVHKPLKHETDEEFLLRERPFIWSDHEALRLRHWIETHTSQDVSTAIVHDAVTLYGVKHSHHPVVEWLDKLKWDGTPRLFNMFGIGPEYYVQSPMDPVYLTGVARVLFLGAIRRVCEPGCQFDSMVVLEGDQGIGKTAFVRALGAQWYADIHHIDPDSKDLVLNMTGVWIAETSEMKFTSYADIVKIKSFLSRNVDRIRLPYERLSRMIPRQTVFVGTINPDATGEYLKDPTGNRRFLPVSCISFDLERFKRDREQIFAEAYAIYLASKTPGNEEQGRTWLRGTEEGLAYNYQRLRQTTDLWDDLFDNFVADNDVSNGITGERLLLQAFGISAGHATRSDQLRIARILKDRGFERVKQYDTKEKRSRWVYKPRTIEPPDFEI